jgi:hypothetical protein
MISNSRLARAGTFLIILSASGCSLFNGVYLHNDSYQQKADSAQTGFGKIDLTSKFNDQFTKVTSYDDEEDHAVAQLQVASRNQQLQYFIQLPGWYDKNACTAKNTCSGPAALKDYVQTELKRLTGQTSLTDPQAQAVLNALVLPKAQQDQLDDNRNSLALDLNAFQNLSGDKRTTSCPAAAPVIPRPPHVPPFDADYYWKDALFFCGRIEAISRNQPMATLQAWLDHNSDLYQLIDKRAQAVTQRQKDQSKADALAAQIKEATESSGKPDTYSDEMRTKVADAQTALKDAPPLAKYLGYKALADTLQSFLSAQISQNATQNQAAAAQTNAKSAPKTSQAQAAIDLAISGANLVDDYAGQGSYDRVNSLLLATAAARHQADMAKLDADYQADLITIYDAEISTQLREVTHLNEASIALGSRSLSDEGYASIPLATKVQKRKAQKQIDALAAWSASQDEGEIPYQVLQAKEVQLLRAQSVKEGQASAQGYESVIKPVLAELDAYGKGGITTQTLVQALGFVGVIASISAK